MKLYCVEMELGNSYWKKTFHIVAPRAEDAINRAFELSKASAKANEEWLLRECKVVAECVDSIVLPPAPAEPSEVAQVIDQLFAHAAKHPEGFAVGDTSPADRDE